MKRLFCAAFMLIACGTEVENYSLPLRGQYRIISSVAAEQTTCEDIGQLTGSWTLEHKDRWLLYANNFVMEGEREGNDLVFWSDVEGNDMWSGCWFGINYNVQLMPLPNSFVATFVANAVLEECNKFNCVATWDVHGYHQGVEE